MFVEHDAKAIGSGSEGAQTTLQVRVDLSRHSTLQGFAEDPGGTFEHMLLQGFSIPPQSSALQQHENATGTLLVTLPDVAGQCWYESCRTSEHHSDSRICA
jgi:hypothetical protein